VYEAIFKSAEHRIEHNPFNIMKQIMSKMKYYESNVTHSNCIMLSFKIIEIHIYTFIRFYLYTFIIYIFFLKTFICKSAKYCSSKYSYSYFIIGMYVYKLIFKKKFKFNAYVCNEIILKNECLDI